MQSVETNKKEKISHLNARSIETERRRNVNWRRTREEEAILFIIWLKNIYIGEKTVI